MCYWVAKHIIFLCFDYWGTVSVLNNDSGNISTLVVKNKLKTYFKDGIEITKVYWYNYCIYV